MVVADSVGCGHNLLPIARPVTHSMEDGEQGLRIEPNPGNVPPTDTPVEDTILESAVVFHKVGKLHHSVQYSDKTTRFWEGIETAREEKLAAKKKLTKCGCPSRQCGCKVDGQLCACLCTSNTAECYLCP